MNHKYQRHRHHLILGVDELPVFRSSADLLTTVALPQCRKYKVHTIGCAQGASAFPQGAEDRLLQAFLALTGIRFFFRHNSEVDCTLFGRHAALSTYSPLIEKYRHHQPMQFQEGHQLVELVDTSITDSESDTDGRSDGTTTMQTDTWNTGSSLTINDSEGTARDRRLLRETVNEARSEARAQQDGRGGSTGTSSQTTATHSRTMGRGRGITRKQQLVPVIKTVDVCTNVTFFQKEELDAMGAALIANQRVGQAIMHASGFAPVQVTFPYAGDTFAACPRFAAKKEADHLAAQAQHPGFASVEQIQEQRQRLLRNLLHRLTASSDQNARAALSHNSHAVIDGARPDPTIVVLKPTNDPVNTPLGI